MLQERLFSR
jgi:sphingolipid delta-4 desaturase